MGLYIEIIAIGPFSEVARKYLGYPDESYDGTEAGAIVNCTLFGIVEGTSLGKEFASCLGVTDVWDFNQHKIVNVKTMWQRSIHSRALIPTTMKM